ncbi:MAG: hypothetical protein ACAH83_09955 [Alphaproteobacteria bacterium]
MNKILYALAFVALLCAGIASPAAAKQMQFPEKATIGFTFDLPDGWLAALDPPGTTLTVRTPGDNATAMILTVIDDPNEKGTLEDVTKAALEVGKAEPYSKQEDTDISGVTGKTFFSTMSSGGVDFNLRMSVFKIGTTYLTATEATQAGMTEEQHHLLATLGLAITGGQ